MAHYIDKDALVAEIKEWLTEIEKLSQSKEADDEYGKGFCDGRRGAYRKILSSINSLEGKEVDLEEELDSFAYTLPHSAIGDGEHLGNFDDPKVKEARKNGWSHSWRYNYVKEIAKHFFELGVNASNPPTWEDINSILYIERLVLREFGGQEQSNEELCREVLKRFKVQKGE